MQEGARTVAAGAFVAAPSVQPRGLRLGPAVFAALCYLVSPYIGLTSFTVDDRIAEVWPISGVGFVLLAAVWGISRRAVGATLAAMVTVNVVTALLLEHAAPEALWLGITGAAQPLLMMLLYRRLRGAPGWAPRGPSDVAYLLLATVASTALVGVLGGYPQLPITDLSATVLMWWVLRSSVFCFVVAVVFSVLFHLDRDDVLPAGSWANTAALTTTGAVCLYGLYTDPSLPLSWLLIVPSVWGGMTLSLRGTAYLILYIALLAAGLTFLPGNRFGYAGTLPAASIVDLLIIASTSFALLLTLMREQRARLIAELDEKGREAQAQRDLLAVVADSMTEGFMVVDGGLVQTHNAAARKLLGRAVPEGAPVSWVDGFGASGPDGQPLTESEVQALLDPTGAAPGSVELRVGTGRSARILEVLAKPLRRRDDGVPAEQQVLLLRDVTAQRARLRELTSFAGLVAHDLRGPLTVLDGWLEVALDEDADPAHVASAIGRAHEAGGRMRQVIEDWIGYTVVQQGRLRPVDVKLGEVAAVLVESRRSSGARRLQPRFALDLTHTVRVDPALLRQLLDNLVDNAVKYTPPSQAPVVSVRSLDDLEPGWVRVEVEDEGLGVPAGQEEEIFEEFYRGPTTGRWEGTGLGLALTRRIVAMHGGAITARRNPERGSTFSFTLPTV